MLKQLEDVKDLFEEKFGHSVDQEIMNKDGIDVIVTRGAPPSTESMLKQLEEVKDLFEEKFGHSVDQEIMNKDGMDVIVTRGAPPSTESMLEQLQGGPAPGGDV